METLAVVEDEGAIATATASAPTSGYRREERGKRRAFDTVISYVYLSRDCGAIDSMLSWEQSHAMRLKYICINRACLLTSIVNMVMLRLCSPYLCLLLLILVDQVG